MTERRRSRDPRTAFPLFELIAPLVLFLACLGGMAPW